MKRLVFDLAGRFPRGFWERLYGTGSLFPYYHMVSDRVVRHVSPLYSFPSVRKFRDDLDFFLSNGHPISVTELISALERKGRPPARSFLLSFDDGFREMYDIVLPILLEKGVPAAFFVTSASVDNRALIHHQKIALLLAHSRVGGDQSRKAIREKLFQHDVVTKDLATSLREIRWGNGQLVQEVAAICRIDFERYLVEEKPYLTAAQLCAMQAQGMHIGAHSIDHPLFSEIPLMEQLRQTRESVGYVSHVLGNGPRAFAFPHTDNGVSADFFRIVREEKLLSVTFGTGAPRQDPNPWNVERFSMEKMSWPARTFVGRNLLREARFRASRKLMLDRE